MACLGAVSHSLWLQWGVPGGGEDGGGRVGGGGREELPGAESPFSQALFPRPGCQHLKEILWVSQYQLDTTGSRGGHLPLEW